MSEQTQITIETNPSFREYRILLNDEDVAQPNGYLPQNSFLGAFWRTGLAAFCRDRKSAGLLRTDHSVVRVADPLVRAYCQAKKNVFEPQRDQKDVLTFLEKSSIVMDTAEWERSGRLFEEKILAFRQVVGEKRFARIPAREIMIFNSAQDESFLASLQEKRLREDGMTVGEICEHLRISLKAEVDCGRWLLESERTPCVPILTEKEKDSYLDVSRNRIRRDGDLLFVSSKEREEIEVDIGCSSFWYVKDGEPMIELVLGYLDFFFLRFRLQEIWNLACDEAQLKDWNDVRRLVSIGIRHPSYLLDVRDPRGVVHTTYRAMCPCIQPFGVSGESALVPPAPAISPIDAHYEATTEEVSLALDEIFEYCMRLNVDPQTTGLYVYDGARLVRTEGEYAYDIASVADGCAAALSLEPERVTGRGGLRKRDGIWISPLGETVRFNLKIDVEKNGRYDPGADPICYEINGEEVPAERFVVTQRSHGGVTARVSTRKSGKSAECRVLFIPHADDVVVDVGLLQTKAGGICSVEYEKEETGLTAQGKKGRRISSITCFEGTGFQIVHFPVWRTDCSLPTWEGETWIACDSDVQSFLVQDDRFMFKSASENTLRFAIVRDGRKDVVYSIRITCIKDRSIPVRNYLLGAGVLAGLTQVCWYGLNVLTILIYLLAPLSAITVFYCAERWIRTQGQRWILIGSGGLSLFCLAKAILEELAG